MKALVLAVSVLFLGAPAFATGGFWCEFEKDGVKFSVNGVTTRSFAGDIVQAEAELEKAASGQLPKVYRKFEKSDIRQYWNLGDEFRLVIYGETDSEKTYNWTQVVILTSSKDVDGEVLEGTIEIQHGDGERSWSVGKSKITCSVE